MNLHLKRARVSAVLLLLLAVSPCTAPFAVCDIADGSHQSEDSAIRHIIHAGAVVRPVVKITRCPVILNTAASRAATVPGGPGGGRRPSASPPPTPARQLVLRL